jgi:hypothetical protein
LSQLSIFKSFGIFDDFHCLEKFSNLGHIVLENFLLKFQHLSSTQNPCAKLRDRVQLALSLRPNDEPINPHS